MKNIFFLILLCICLKMAATAQKGKLIMPIVPLTDVSEISFSPDGRFMISSTGDLTIKQSKFTFWDTKTTKYLFSISGEDYFQSRSIFSADSKFLLVFGGSNIACLDIFKQSIIWTKEGSFCGMDQQGNVLMLQYSWTDEKSTINRVTIATGNTTELVLKDRSRSPVVKYSNTGKYIGRIRSNASLSSDDLHTYDNHTDSLDLYIITESKLKANVLLDEKGFIDYKFSNDDKYIIAISRDSTVTCIDLMTGAVRYKKPIGFLPNDLQLDADAKLYYLTSSSSSSSRGENGEIVTIWETKNGDCTDTLRFAENIKKACINSVKGQLIILADSLRIYEMAAKKFTTLHNNESSVGISAISCNNLGTLVAIGFNNGDIDFIDPKDLDRRRLGSFYTPLVKTAFVNDSLFISWNDHNYTSGADDWIERTIGYPFRDFVKQWSIFAGLKKTKGFNGGESQHTIHISSDNRMIITYDVSDQFSVWQTISGKKVCSFPRNPEMDFFGFKFSGNGQFLATSTLAQDRSRHVYECQVRNLITRKAKVLKLQAFGQVAGITNKGDFIVLYYEGEQIPGTNEYGNYLEIWDVVKTKMKYRLVNLETDMTNYVLSDNRPFFIPFNDSYFVVLKGTRNLYNYSVKDTIPRFLIPYHIQGKDTLIQSDFLISPKGNFLLTRAGTLLFLWNNRNGNLIDTLEMDDIPEQCRFSPDESLVFAVRSGFEVYDVILWKLKSKEKIRKFITNDATISELNDRVNSISVNTNNKFAIISSTNNFLTLIDIDEMKIAYTVVPFGLKDYIAFDQTGNHTWPEGWTYFNFICPETLSLISSDLNSKFVPNLIPVLMLNKTISLWPELNNKNRPSCK